MARALLVSGFDIRDVPLPDDAEVLLPPLPLPAHDDFKEQIQRALDEPLEGLPLGKRVKSTSKVTIVLDDFVLPVPLALNDARRAMLEAVLESLTHFQVKAANVTALVATGLARQWRPAELTEFLGPRSTSMINVRSHDAESTTELSRIADEPEGPVELSKHVVETDLVIHLSVVSMPLAAGTFSLVQGTAGYRTARVLNSPKLFDDDKPLTTGSKWHAAHTRIGALLTKKVQVLQVAAVLNNELWTSSIASLLQSDAGLSRPLQMWNALPGAVRHRAARVMRASYGPIAALAGPTHAVAPRALELFLRQHEVQAKGGEADVLLFGLPDLGPYSVGTAQNPVLVANLALGYVSNLFTRAPLIREGGVIVFLNPLSPAFDARAHRPHLDFYEKVLRVEREAQAIHERYEPYLASRPELVADYQRRYAFHGAHPLVAWYQCAPARRRTSRIIVAGGDPRACARLGFMGASDLDDAMRKAKEALAMDSPFVRVLELPPPFFVRV
ncbi:MAG: DUF2088 domain-containing protein [Myxococcaceae bacterium]|nr:DUF2088 domain-containing protein [Myxococcaceae bacterium]